MRETSSWLFSYHMGRLTNNESYLDCLISFIAAEEDEARKSTRAMEVVMNAKLAHS